VSLNWILILAGAVLILFEVILGAATGFDFLLVGSALLLGGFLGLLTKSTALGVAAAGALALVYVLYGRKRIRSRLVRKGIASNVDAILGKVGRVHERIASDHIGRVKLEGDEWRAGLVRSSDGPLEPGRDVRIVRVDGVTVFVEPADSAGGGASS
jgi:membrane protein implicated in regulation of membrane protease activity